MQIEPPYLLFLGDAHDALAAKTAYGILDWRRDWCLAQLRLAGCQADLGLPDMTSAQAAAAGAKTMVIGVVNAGGVLPDSWREVILSALDAGLDVASGLHAKLASLPGVAERAAARGRRLFDVRHPTQSFSIGKGAKRAGKRLLTVGTDCSVGKKYCALAIAKEMSARDIPCDFRATGQTGILIAGGGVAIDAVVADFIAGAAEWLSPDNAPDHWDVIEGQGSLFHPSFAGVTLGLLHGSQPDAFVVCHEPTRKTMRGVDHPLPDIQDVIDMTVAQGKLTSPQIQCVGIAINTAALDDEGRKRVLGSASESYGYPAVDPIKTGVGAIIDHIKKIGL